MLSNFKADKLFVIGGVFPCTQQLGKAEVIKSAEDLPDLPIVLLAPDNGLNEKGVVNLKDFKHPKDAIYIFGSDSVQMSRDFLGRRKINYRVFIDTDTKDDMYSFVAYAVTMFDRRRKWR